MQIFHLFVQPCARLSIHVTSAVCATAWLTVLDDAQPTVFDNDIDMDFRV